MAGAAALSVTLAHAETGPTTLSGEVAGTVACAGRVAEVTRSSASDVSVSCVHGIERVGEVETFARSRSRVARTGLPEGTTAGTLLIATVQTPSWVTASMDGWTKAYDTASSARYGVRLATWWRIATDSEPDPVASLSRRTRVSMTTIALAGAAGTTPVGFAEARPGMSAALPDPSAGPGLWLLSLAADSGRRAWIEPPSEATVVAGVANRSGARTEQAVLTVDDAGPASLAWTGTGVRRAVTGLVTVVPGPAAAVPEGATGIAPGASLDLTCGTEPLEYAAVDPTTLVVTCDDGASGEPGESPSPTEPSADPTESTPATEPSASASPSDSPSDSSPGATPSVSSPEPTPSSSSPGEEVPPPSGSAPGTPEAVCETAALAGPASPPAGAIAVQPAQDLDALVDSRSGGTTYWLAPGTHTLGESRYAQIVPKTGDTFIGAPGAVLDGRNVNAYAFGGGATDVTIATLTIQNFGSAGGNNNEGVVNHDSSRGWTLSHNTIQNNAGAGIMIGSDNQILGNCLRDNRQYGFNAYHPSGVTDVVMNGNEIAGNNTDDWEKRRPGCGCTGGGKFWETRGAVVTNNYVHDNKGVGLWADSNNAGFLFQGNYISGNDSPGIMYETSYNAAILDNTFVRNAIVDGPTNPGFPTGAIYISEAGSDSRVGGPYGEVMRISGNVFRDNWSGIVAWENADRFAGSPANTSSGMTTLVNPSVATVQACSTPSTVASKPYFDDCRWKTQNLLVDHNTFALNAANVPGCSPEKGCGFNGLFSNYGSYPSWSPYKGDVVEKNITFQQNNVWQDNTYQGPWRFMAYDQSRALPLADWQAAPYGQDARSAQQ